MQKTYLPLQVYVLPYDEDQPTTCPKCCTRTDSEQIEKGTTKERCLNTDSCGYVFLQEQETRADYRARRRDTR